MTVTSAQGILQSEAGPVATRPVLLDPMVRDMPLLLRQEQGLLVDGRIHGMHIPQRLPKGRLQGAGIPFREYLAAGLKQGLGSQTGSTGLVQSSHNLE